MCGLRVMGTRFREVAVQVTHNSVLLHLERKDFYKKKVKVEMDKVKKEKVENRVAVQFTHNSLRADCCAQKQWFQ